MEINAIELIDSYKISHVHMYPPKTDFVYSNFTARSNKHANVLNKDQDFTVFVGLQATLKMLTEIWQTSFFDQPKEKVLAAYQRRVDGIVGPGTNISHMRRLHDLGYLPIEVRALPEGSIVPLRVPYFTVANTLPGFGWLTNYLEDFFSAESWKMINNATLAYELRSIVTKYFAQQGVSTDLIPFMCHDFSFRGMSGIHDGMKTSFAHMTSFAGSDSVSGVSFAEEYYGANVDKELVTASVPASEHSVMMSSLESGELETFRRLFRLYPTGIISIVSDTWDFFRVITEYAAELKSEIMAREGKLVYRPDSGIPVDILCGTAIPMSYANRDDWKDGQIIVDDGTYYQVEWKHNEYDGLSKNLRKLDSSEVTAEMKGAVECLWEVFGGTTNYFGYRTLDSHVGLIYGDSINADQMNQILARMECKKFAANNVVYGIGSYSYNMSSRDTWGMAMKATWAMVDGVARDLQKDPKTGDGIKKSACGLINVYRENGKLVARDNQALVDSSDKNELKLVYQDGNILVNETLAGIRELLWGWKQ